MKQYFDKNHYKFDKVIVECSPFLRCIMTAGQIAKGLGVEEVTINYRASEILLEYFDENPMAKLEYA